MLGLVSREYGGRAVYLYPDEWRVVFRPPVETFVVKIFHLLIVSSNLAVSLACIEPSETLRAFFVFLVHGMSSLVVVHAIGCTAVVVA